MKKIVLLSIGMAAFVLQNASAQTELFTTYQDFQQWSAVGGTTVAADNTFSVDSGTINGVGNNTAAGASGSLGALSITWGATTGTYNTIAAGNVSGANAAFLSAIDPGSSGNNSVAASGNIYMDYSIPDNEGGSYFELGVNLQYSADGYYGTFFQSSSTDLGIQDPYGDEVYQVTIPYTINAGTFNGFGFGIQYNSNYSPALPFYVDNISVSATQTVPEPASMALVGFGLTGLFLIRRRRMS